MSATQVLSTPHCTAEVVALLGALEQESGDIGRAMASAIQDDLAPFAAAARHDATFRKRFAAHCEQHVRTFVATTRRGRMAGTEDLGFVHEVGVRRADDAFPLAALLLGLQVGHRVLSGRIAQLGALHGSSASAVLWLTGQGVHYLEAISVTLTESYQARQRLTAGRSELTRRELLDDLLEGRYPTRPDAAAVAASVGFEQDAQYCVCVVVPAAAPVDPPDIQRRAHMLAADVNRAAFTITTFRFVVVRRDAVVAVLRAADTTEVLGRAQALARARGLALQAGVSTACRGIAEVPRGYWEAVRALGFATRDRPCVDLRSTGLLTYLAASADALAQRLAAQVAGGLVPGGVARSPASDKLARTVVTYVDCNLSASRTADRLGVHLNTVHNRLERVAGLLKQRTLGPIDLVELAAAVRICELHPEARAAVVTG
jgi:sugar diacid utilization regulator